MTENERKLQLQHSTMIRYIYRQLGWDQGANAHALDNYTQVVESERPEPIHWGMTIGSRHDSVDEFVKAQSASERAEPTEEGQEELRQFALDEGRCYGKNKQGVRCRKRLVPPNAYCSGDCDFSAEPTATEPEVPEVEQCTMEDNEGIRCRNRVQQPGWSRCSVSRIYCNFGPAPAPDVPYTHCSACGMRSHGTNAELRSQVDELRAKLRASETSFQDAAQSARHLQNKVDRLKGQLKKAVTHEADERARASDV